MKTWVLILSLLSVNSALADDYKYAPRQKVVQGTPILTCVGVTYSEEPNNAISASKCMGMANQTRDFYKRNSRGLLNIVPKSGSITVQGKKTGANYQKAVAAAKAKFPNSDDWAVTGNPGTSHAAGHVAYLKGPLYRDIQHEYGHLTGLGHAGRYELINGKWVLKAYNDSLSVMGRFPSNYLTVPQYYSRGWLLENEAAMYVAGQTYDLKQVAKFDQQTGLMVVIVPPEVWNPDTSAPAVTLAAVEPDDDEELPEVAALPDAGRKAYVSWAPVCPKGTASPCFTLHLAQGVGQGTQKVGTFTEEYYDTLFTGMHVKILSVVNNLAKISIDFDKKPAPVPPVKK